MRIDLLAVPVPEQDTPIVPLTSVVESAGRAMRPRKEGRPRLICSRRDPSYKRRKGIALIWARGGGREVR